MKRKHFLLATAALVMAGCANEDFVGENVQNPLSGEQAIGFNMNMPAMTRAEQTGSDAATTLNNTFYVWGEKNEKTDGSIAEATDLVFKNYTVSYTDGSANTTTSNTKGWEYVGLASTVSSSYLAPQSPTPQVIKYWDKDADSYTFTAVSAKPDDITGTTNKVEIKKIQSSASPASALAKGYEITIKDLDAAGRVFVSDRVNIAKAALVSGNPKNAYGGYVNLTFRNFQSKIRFGIYETVPGYKVVITGLKYTNNNSTEVPNTHGGSDETFAVTGDFIAASASPKYTVTYEGTTSYTANTVTENRAKVEVSSTNNDKFLNTTGTNWLKTSWTNTSNNSCIKTAANEPTWDKGTATNGSDSWTAILPNPKNVTPLTLVISYDLYSEDTGEKISVDYKTVKVPAEYCQWKPNFAYTYLFKITDKSADLYPITFDAVVITDETGNQQTITTVDEPSSWTVFASDADGSAYKTITNEFTADDVIYATLSNNGTPVDLTSTGKLYTVTTTNSTNYPITEASVADALKQVAVGKTVTKLNVQPVEVSPGTVNFESNVPSEDGNKVSLGTGKAMYWTALTNTVYAVEYAPASGDKIYKVIKIGGADGNGATITNP